LNTRSPKVPGYFSLAPMIDKTDRHFRWFIRQMSKKIILYTEMITAPAVLHGNRNKLLDYPESDHPIILQLGADKPEQLYEAVKIAEDWGYDEYNLNVGCPSDKVQNGNFGACLMADTNRVLELLDAMQQAGTKPVGIKHRIGIEGFGIKLSAKEDLFAFVQKLRLGPAQRFIVHARLALLEGLSPKENRSVPPLRYEDVWELKKRNADLHIEINGNIRSLQDLQLHRAQGMDDACEEAFLGAESELLSESLGESSEDLEKRKELALAYASYIDEQVSQGAHPRSLVWPSLELFRGLRGARHYKQILSASFTKTQNMQQLFHQALEQLER